MSICKTKTPTAVVKLCWGCLSTGSGLSFTSQDCSGMYNFGGEPVAGRITLMFSICRQSLPRQPVVFSIMIHHGAVLVNGNAVQLRTTVNITDNTFIKCSESGVHFVLRLFAPLESQSIFKDQCRNDDRQPLVGESKRIVDTYYINLASSKRYRSLENARRAGAGTWVIRKKTRLVAEIK